MAGADGFEIRLGLSSLSRNGGDDAPLLLYAASTVTAMTIGAVPAGPFTSSSSLIESLRFGETDK